MPSPASAGRIRWRPSSHRDLDPSSDSGARKGNATRFFFLVARPPAVEDGGIPVVGAANGQLRWFGAKARGPCTAASSTRESGLPFSTCVPKSGSTRHLVRSTKQRKHTQVPSLQLMPPSGRACPTCAVSLLVRHPKKERRWWSDRCCSAFNRTRRVAGKRSPGKDSLLPISLIKTKTTMGRR
jgi:hypothetical protein